MDGLIDEMTDTRINKMDRWMDVFMDRWINGWWVDRQINIQMDGWKDRLECMAGWMDD